VKIVGPAEKLCIAQNLWTPFKNTYHFLVGEGYGNPGDAPPAVLGLGLVSADSVTGGGSAKTIHTASS
jgi:hypothetical protein